MWMQFYFPKGDPASLDPSTSAKRSPLWCACLGCDNVPGNALLVRHVTPVRRIKFSPWRVL